MNYAEESLKLHRQKKGKLEIASKVPLGTKDDMSTAYTPGVAAPCMEIARDKNRIYDYTIKQNSVAVVTDGSAVLGLGNIGPEAALPVMEGKAILFKKFGGIDAYPICLASQNTDKIVETVKLISVGFGGINLEDISAPRCFEVEERLKRELDIPVFHDDQHGTAIVVLAGLLNALNVVGKRMEDVSIVISGAGAAENLILTDTTGIIYEGRKDNMNHVKEHIAEKTNRKKLKGNLADALKGADVLIGVSGPNTVTKGMIETMNNDAIVFAMANPVPEIMPANAKAGGARIVATGRSDFPNQINNVLAFPGVFRGALDVRARDINEEMKHAAAHALAGLIANPNEEKIISSPFDKGVAEAVAKAVSEAARKSGVARI